MDELVVIWTRTALKQRDSIFEYCNNRNKSKSYSKKLNGLIRNRIDLLKIEPELGKQTVFEKVRTVSLRHY
jgi:plasmid stabilization system protein ParE